MEGKRISLLMLFVLAAAHLPSMEAVQGGRDQGGFLIKTKIGKTYLGKTAKGHHFQVSDRDSESKTADGQDFGAKGLNRQHDTWPSREPTTTTESWPPKTDRWPTDDHPPLGVGGKVEPDTTTIPPTTTPKDSWPPRITTPAAWKQRDDHDQYADIAEDASDEGEDYANKKKR